MGRCRPHHATTPLALATLSGRAAAATANTATSKAAVCGRMKEVMETGIVGLEIRDQVWVARP